MSAVWQVLKLSFWGTAVQRLGTLAGLGLALGVSLFAMPLGLRRSALGLMTLGIAIACLPLMALGGSMWRAVSAQRAVMLAPGGRQRLLAAAVAVAVLAALLLPAFSLVSWVPRVIADLMSLADRLSDPEFKERMAEVFGLPMTMDARHYLIANVKSILGQHPAWWSLFASGFGFATWWGLAAFCGSRSPLAALITLIVLVAGAASVPQIATMVVDALMVDAPWCRQPVGAFCATMASSRVGWPPAATIALALVLWCLFGAWYLRARRIVAPGWLLPGGQSLLAMGTVDGSAGRARTRAAALERLLLGGSSIAWIIGQWLLAGVLLLTMLLLLARLVEPMDPAHVSWVLRAVLVAASGIMLALALAILQRARAVWLPSSLDRAGLFGLVRYSLLQLALGLGCVSVLLLVALRHALPWPQGLSLAQASVALLATNLLLVAHVLNSHTGLPRIASLGAVLLLWWAALAAPLLRGAAGSWAWPFAMLVAAAALLLLARRRWLQADLPGRAG